MKETAKGRPIFSHAAVVSWACVFLLAPMHALAVNTGTENFKAVILPGTCDATISTPSVYFNVGSQSVTTVAISNALQTSTANLTLQCTGFGSGGKPTLSVSGSQDGGVGNADYRLDASSAANTALVFRVQYKKAGDNNAAWSDPLVPGDYAATASETDLDMNGKAIPLQFSMWCAPTASQTITNCKETHAGGTVSLSVKYP